MKLYKNLKIPEIRKEILKIFQFGFAIFKKSKTKRECVSNFVVDSQLATVCLTHTNKLFSYIYL